MSDQPEESAYVRPSWDEYFMEIAHTVSKRATCDRGRSGCVIARDRQILVTGYVGSPKGLPHCDDVGHQLKKVMHEDGHVTMHCVRTVHAEQNAIIQAAYHGVSLKDASIFCTNLPCSICAKMIINAGIDKIYYRSGYADELSKDMLQETDIELIHIETKQQGEDS